MSRADQSPAPAREARARTAASHLRHLGHLVSLDGIRGLAILLVVLHNTNPIEDPESLAQRLVGLAVDWGWVGVQLFFVLSGLLITGILLDTARAPNYYGAFFARRVLRIFPLYYGVLFVAFALTPLVLGHPIDGYRQQLWFWAYLSNWGDPFGHSIPAFPHFWSLAVEEQFYLFWPFVVRRAGARGVLWVGGAMAVGALACRVGLLLAGFSHMGPYSFTVCRVDALVLGAMAAVLLREPSAVAWIERHARALKWGAGALLVVGALVTRGYPRITFLTQTAGYSILALVFTVFVLFAALVDIRGDTSVGAAKGTSWLRAGWLRTLGKYSYAIYVLHIPIQQIVAQPLLRRLTGGHVSVLTSVAYMGGTLAASLLAAVASYHLFEKHFLGLKSRFVARGEASERAGEPASQRAS
jgi:peptidoglycan/LPS O-acetylase OafA/YrhL